MGRLVVDGLRLVMVHAAGAVDVGGVVARPISSPTAVFRVAGRRNHSGAAGSRGIRKSPRRSATRHARTDVIFPCASGERSRVL